MAMTTPYEYGIEIAEDDPREQQPTKIKIALKPHQLASIYKACLMEREGCVHYNIPNPEMHLHLTHGRRALYRGHFNVHTNLGILGDIVGYGKTLTALGIVALTPIRDIHEDREFVYSHTGGSRNRSFIRINCEKPPVSDLRQLFETTLVIVPRGPVYNQWETALKEHTTLKYLAVTDLRVIKKKFPPIGSTNEQLKTFFEGYDVILIKNTNVKTMIEHYDVPFRESPIRGFGRIMIDEAPDILSSTPHLDYKFIWFISATYRSLYTSYNSYSNMSLIVRELMNEERSSVITVRCNTIFTKLSFDIPPCNEIVHICLPPRSLTIVQPFLTRNAIELINANDIAGAIRELGGKTETEDNLVKIVTRNLEREIFNKQREKEFVETLDLGTDAKTARIEHINNDLEKLQKRMKDLEERIMNMSTDTCPICYEEIVSPIMLSCTHAFCGKCIMKWLDTRVGSNPHLNGHIEYNHNKVCPTCRSPITQKELVAVVKKGDNTGMSSKKHEELLSKIDTIMKIIKDKPNGKFLVFSQYDYAFKDMIEALEEEDIISSEMKGSTAQMTKTLDRFRNGELKVIMLNTLYAGSGIDISCATDVILLHSMGISSEQAIGRAQRVGRTETLTVHKLCYPHEKI
ncbi:DEAD protein [Dishui Lake large algae virus 1]|nr:DEAD protein [Dishui Lake large algae virus 1]